MVIRDLTIPGVENASALGLLIPENFEVPRKYSSLSFVKYFKLICTWFFDDILHCITLVSAPVKSFWQKIVTVQFKQKI